MLNYIWAFMIIVSFICAIFNGKIEMLSNSILEGSNEAINLTIATLGSMAFWSGIMEIAQNSNLTKKIANIFYPVLSFLFPEHKFDNNILHPICMNIISNMLGLGNAATPFGLEAIKNMQKLNREKDKASNSMIMFIIINTSCLQLIPTFLAVIRKTHGAKNPFDILIPLWIVSILTLIFGITINKIICKVNFKKNITKFNTDFNVSKTSYLRQ